MKKTLSLAMMMALSGAAVAESQWPGGPGTTRGTTGIATGPTSTDDGFLSISPDDFGQWASTGFGGGGDNFNPVGGPTGMETGFSSAFYLAVPGRNQRIVLSENAQHLAIADDSSLTLAVTTPLAASDTNADTVNDTLTSAFTVTGTDTSLSVDLTQSVMAISSAVALVSQTYTFTNDAASAIDFNLVRVFDGDLLWDVSADFLNDSVGTNFHRFPNGELYVVMREAGDSTLGVTLSSPTADAYFGGKQNTTPPMSIVPYDFGTDTEVFDNFGIPAGWENHIAEVGYNTNGSSTGTGTDAFLGLSFDISLAASESIDVTVNYAYGQAGPVNFDLIFADGFELF